MGKGRLFYIFLFIVFQLFKQGYRGAQAIGGRKVELCPPGATKPRAATAPDPLFTWEGHPFFRICCESESLSKFLGTPLAVILVSETIVLYRLKQWKYFRCQTRKGFFTA